MNGKHTPGPWSVYFEHGTNPGIEALSKSIVVWGDKSDDCGVRGKTREEILANAFLIAAAPDLLEALESVLNAWQYGETVNIAKSEYQSAQAAIAKAKGGLE